MLHSQCRPHVFRRAVLRCYIGSRRCTHSEADDFMNPSSEERLSDEAAKSKPVSARILPFERPPTRLQRAVQERAQEAMERDRERSKRRPAPLKWTVICVLALVPVLTLVFAVDAFVRLFQHINETYIQADAPA